MKPDRPKSSWRELGSFGFHFLGSVAIGIVFGFLADKKFGTSPILAVVGLLAGVVLGIYQLYRIGNEN